MRRSLIGFAVLAVAGVDAGGTARGARARALRRQDDQRLARLQKIQPFRITAGLSRTDG